MMHPRSAGSLSFTESSSQMEESTDSVNLEELEDSLPPVYLRDNATFRSYMKERQRREDLARMGQLIKDNNIKSKEDPKWKLGEINYNAWKENTLDKM